MIIQNFENSGSAEGAVNYVLSSHDHTGKRRSVEPKILRGDPDTTKEICREFCQRFSNKTVSGVLSFRDNEDITDEQKQKLMDDFADTFFSNMKERVNILWIEHRDKSNLEMHYVINRLDLDSGKIFNPFPPGGQTKELMKLFSAVKNHEFGFKQIEGKPLKTKFSSNEIKCKNKKNHGFENLDSKLKIESALQMLVKSGDIKNRKELIEFLQENGKKLSRIGDHYISIEVEGGRNIRLKGGIFSKNEDKDYKQVVQEFKDSKQTFDIVKAVSKLNKIVEQRNSYNEERYTAEKAKPIFIKLTEIKRESKEQSSPPPGSRPIQPLQAIASPIESQTHDRQGSTASESSKALQDKDSEPQSDNTPVSSGIATGVASAMSAVENAKGQLANARTEVEKVRARFALAMAMKRLEEEGFKAEEEKRKQQKRKM
jgi:hypothetical protein